VADTLDAIVSDRPYRRGRPLAEARKEIVAWTGRQFDPEVVKVFMTIPDEIFEDLRREIDGHAVPPFLPLRPPRARRKHSRER